MAITTVTAITIILIKAGNGNGTGIGIGMMTIGTIIGMTMMITFPLKILLISGKIGFVTSTL
ncbi:hypothetical protein D3C78_1862170 [compost metagenome]